MLSLQNFASIFLLCQNILFFNVNWIQNIVRKGYAFLIWGPEVRKIRRERIFMRLSAAKRTRRVSLMEETSNPLGRTI